MQLISFVVVVCLFQINRKDALTPKKIMPRLLRNPFSLRQCKCLFVSVLLVCAVMVLVALKLHPELVKAPFHYDSNSLTSGGKTRISIRETSADQSSNGDGEWTDSVQFLPHTESTPGSAGDQTNKGSQTIAPQHLESIIKAGPIYYHQKVPGYVPDNTVARGIFTKRLFTSCFT